MKIAHYKSFFICLAIILSISFASAAFFSPPFCTSSDDGSEQKTLTLGQTDMINGLITTVDYIDYQFSIKVRRITNTTASYDTIQFEGSNGDIYDAVIMSEGTARVTIQGEDYVFTYSGDAIRPPSEWYITFQGENLKVGDYISSFKDLIRVRLSSEIISQEFQYIPPSANNPGSAMSFSVGERTDNGLLYTLSLISATQNSALIKVETLCDICQENWVCQGWGICSFEGKQRRTCTDLNWCRTNVSKPTETQTCTNFQVCSESWKCNDWSTCTNNKQTRTCTNSNACVTTINKPAEFQTCTLNSCIENWKCNDWSTCTNNKQTRTCTDSNACGTTKNKPSTSEVCVTPICTENWYCGGWDTCLDNKQTRTCTDSNNCGLLNNKPSESQNCDSSTISFKLRRVINTTSGFTNDKVELESSDGLIYRATIIAEGIGAIEVRGKSFSLEYHDNPTILDDEYIIINNKIIYKSGFAVEVKRIKNSSSGFTNDQVLFTDLNEGTEYITSFTTEGTGTVDIQGKSYTVTYEGDATRPPSESHITFDSINYNLGDVIILKDIENPFTLDSNVEIADLNACETVGLRDAGKYCASDKFLVEQKETGSLCQNNFECGSNVCVSDECISEGLLRKIINWFKGLFGAN